MSTLIHNHRQGLRLVAQAGAWMMVAAGGVAVGAVLGMRFLHSLLSSIPLVN